MADSLTERYQNFLQNENYNFIDKVTRAVDDFVAQNRNSVRANGWGCPRVRLSLTEIRADNQQLEKELRNDPLRHIRALEFACHKVAEDHRPGYDKNGVKIKVAIEGPIGASASTPRSLTSTSLRQLICVEGVATKVSTVKPKVVKSVHFCRPTNKLLSRVYVDATDPELGLPTLNIDGTEQPDNIVQITPSVYPTKDKDNNPLETEFGMSIFKDHQTITLQEMPEKAPMGQLPRSVELILDYDLVDKIKPGDRVQVVGVHRALATSSSGQSNTSGVFKTVVLVNNVQILGRDVSQVSYSMTDMENIKSLGTRKDILSVLGRSVAPSIHGHDVIKKALVLQLLSGCEKNLANGTHLRGDINILMVGDPSTAKSQLLRSVLTLAPLAVSTTGKGSSGVGLTAAVTSDPDTRERRLEAGAMVLADRGIVCVDEFDKMSEDDRVAIHEAMEQQTVTIAKAGIHASLNARCSVLAAANPVYGQYDRKKRIQENIGLPDSLLSRFDLLFVVLDQLDPDSDRRIASHVIRGHRYKSNHGQAGHDSDYDDDDDDSDDEEHESSNSKSHSIWQKSRYHTSKAMNKVPRFSEDEDDPHSDDVLQHDFLRKYLRYAKTRITPALSEEAREFIATRYAEMRSRQDERTLPVTARSLETVIRLASAHAKARLSKVVEAEPDCSSAMEILSFALYHENTTAPTDDLSIPDLLKEDGVNLKRKRLDMEDSVIPIVSRVDEDTSTKVWNELVRAGDSLAVAQFSLHGSDPENLIRILDTLSNEGKILYDTDEGMVYKI